MKLTFIILILNFIIKIYCGSYTSINELLAALIVAASDNNGNIQQENHNGQFRDLRITVSSPNNPRQLNLDINSIIPSLRANNQNNLFGNLLNKPITFNDIHKMALSVFNKYFNNPIFNNNDDVDNLNNQEIRNLGEQILNELDIFKSLTNDPANTLPPIGIFDGDVKEIYYPSSSAQLTATRYLHQYERYRNNNNNPMPSFRSITTSSQDHIDVIKSFIMHCGTNRNCRNIFSNPNSINNVDIIFVKSDIGGTIRYHPIISNKYTDNIYHPFSLRYDSASLFNYNIDTSYGFKSLSFQNIEANTHGYFKQYNYHNTNNQNSNVGTVNEKGIGLLAICGTTLTFDDNDIEQPSDYGVFVNGVIDSNSVSIISPVTPVNNKIVSNKLKRINGILNNGQLNPSAGIVCSFTDNRFAHILDQIESYFDYHVRYNTLDNKRLLLLNYMIKISCFIRLFPINIEGHSNGIGNGRGHTTEIYKILRISNKIQSRINFNINYALNHPNDPNSKITLNELGNTVIGNSCVFHRGRKRADTCNNYDGIGMKTDYDINSSTVKSLNMINNKNIDGNIPYEYNEEETKIENINDLHNKAETVENLWKYLVDDYINNIEKFTKEESQSFILNFNEVINGYTHYLSDSDYTNHEILKNIDDENITIMKSYYEKAYDLHIKNYGYITDENGEEMIYHIDYNKDSQSLHYKRKLLKNIKTALSIINEHNNNIINEESLGVLIDGDKFSSEIDPMTILESETIEEGIDKICEGIESIDIDSLDEDKQNELNTKINEIMNDLEELKAINQEEYEKTGEPSINSQIVHVFYNSVAKKQGKEIDDSDFTYSEIYLSVPELENINNEEDYNDIVDTLKNNDVSIEAKRYIFKGIENTIIHSEGEYLDDRIFMAISDLETYIRKESSYVEHVNSYERYQNYVNNFVLFTSYYNHLVGVAAQYDKIYSEKLSRKNPVNTIELSNNILLKLLFINNQQLSDAIVEVVKNNPDKYNQDYENNDIFATTYMWNNERVKEVTFSYLTKLFKKENDFKNKATCFKEIISDSGDDTLARHLIKKAYKTKIIHTVYLSPASRNIDDIDDLNLNAIDLNINISKDTIQPIDDYSNAKFYEAMTEISTYNDDVTIDSYDNKYGLANVATLYKGAVSYKDMFNKMEEYVTELYFNDEVTEEIKEKIDSSTNKLNSYVSNTRFKFILTLGREHKNTFNTFIKEFNIISSGAYELIKSHNAVTDNNKFKLNDKLYNFKNINTLNNMSIKLNNISKKIKDLRLKKPTNNK